MQIEYPILFLSGLQDELVPPLHMQMLHSKAIENNLDCRFVDFPNGMHIDTWYSGGDQYWNDPVLHPLTTRSDHVERVLSARYHDAMTILQPQGKELDLLIVILPHNDGSLYGDQKQIYQWKGTVVDSKVGISDVIEVRIVDDLH
ncbi:hypothetical protein ZIOFF_043292 [Zingiber officinale]|uniref:Uncharacterized protein n=1 Tax=Zingiber officinale TaxID=94328 RepID=A0A8J5GAD8_ZINOF|nr:hypothetical protein ZIOFF_043292 [Zingiber officinale]